VLHEEGRLELGACDLDGLAVLADQVEAGAVGEEVLSGALEDRPVQVVDDDEVRLNGHWGPLAPWCRASAAMRSARTRCPEHSHLLSALRGQTLAAASGVGGSGRLAPPRPLWELWPRFHPKPIDLEENLRMYRRAYLALAIGAVLIGCKSTEKQAASGA